MITPRRLDRLAAEVEHLSDQADGKALDALVVHADGHDFAVAVIGFGPEHDAIVAALGQSGTAATEPEWRAAS